MCDREDYIDDEHVRADYSSLKLDRPAWIHIEVYI